MGSECPLIPVETRVVSDVLVSRYRIECINVLKNSESA